MKFAPIPNSLTASGLRVIEQLRLEHLRTVAGTHPSTLRKLVDEGFVRVRDVFRYAVEENFRFADERHGKITVPGDGREDLVPCVELTEEGRIVGDTMSLVRASAKACEALGGSGYGQSSEAYSLDWHIGYLRTNDAFKEMLANEASARKAAAA